MIPGYDGEYGKPVLDGGIPEQKKIARKQPGLDSFIRNS
jgi:hypothetical protein